MRSNSNQRRLPAFYVNAALDRCPFKCGYVNELYFKQKIIKFQYVIAVLYLYCFSDNGKIALILLQYLIMLEMENNICFEIKFQFVQIDFLVDLYLSMQSKFRKTPLQFCKLLSLVLFEATLKLNGPLKLQLLSHLIETYHR